MSGFSSAVPAKPVALVLQGGGALGAYEWGAVNRLLEAGYRPVAVTGVSIGAINAAAIAGARGGDIQESLRRIWEAITLPTLPFVPELVQGMLSAFGNRNFYALRTDYLSLPGWTALCDLSPMRRTLEEICDFARINDCRQMRFAVTATDVGTGRSVRFFNDGKQRICADHVLASGALPPGFPMARIGERHYWDGGLFDNTPLRPLIDLLTEEEIKTLPIVVIDLFPGSGEREPIPTNLFEVKHRMMELSFENRFWEDYGDLGSYRDYAAMLEALNQAVPQDSPMRANPEFVALLRRRCLKNLHVIPSMHLAMKDGLDFSAAGIRRRERLGWEAVDLHLAKDGFAQAEVAA